MDEITGKLVTLKSLLGPGKSSSLKFSAKVTLDGVGDGFSFLWTWTVSSQVKMDVLEMTLILWGRCEEGAGLVGVEWAWPNSRARS